MAKHRQGRINDAMQKEVAEVMRGIKDPRVSNAFLSITHVDVTPDLKYAKVYFSFLNGDKKEILKGLNSSSGYIRREVARNLNLRITPELSFVADSSMEYGAHISSLLKKIEDDDRKRQVSGNGETSATDQDSDNE